MTTTWKNICALITDPHLTQKTNASAEMVTQTASQHRGCDEGQVQYLVIQHTLGGDRGQMEITSNQSTADSLQYAINNTVSTYGNSMVIKQMNKCAGHQTEPKCASNAGSDVVLIRYGVGSESKTNIDEMETHKSDTWKDANGEDKSDCVSMEVEVDRSQLWTEKNMSSENVVSLEDRLICGQCSYVGHLIRDFLIHKSSHVGQKKGQGCELCGQIFSNCGTLTDHYKQRHRVLFRSKESKEKKEIEKSERDHIEKGVYSDGKVLNKVGDVSFSELTVSREILKPSDVNEIENEFVKKVIFHTTLDGNKRLKSHHCKTVDDGEITTSVNNNITCDKRQIEEHNSTGAVEMYNMIEDKDRLETENINEEVSEASETEEKSQVVNSDDVDETNNKEYELADAKTEAKTQYTTVPANLVGINSEITSKVKVEPVVSCVNQNSGDHYLSNIEAQSDVASKTISSGQKNSTFVESAEPDFSFISNVGIIKGQSMFYGKHEFRCLHCPFKTQWRNTLCLHMKEKHAHLIGNDKQLEVNIPPNKDGEKILRMSEYINMQKKKMKVKTVRGIETQDLPGDFPCSICGKVYHRLRYLRCHMKRHAQSSDLLCSECGKAFKTKAYLNQHLRTHRTKEMYQCSQCDFSSISNTLIHAHIQVHSDGCLICDICGTAFTDKTTLQRHKRVHDKSRPFGCKYEGCTLRFKTEVMCNGHYKQHFSKGKFKCGVCGYVFRQKHHLLRHEKSQHSITSAKINEPHVSNADSNTFIRENLDTSLVIDVNANTNSVETSEVNLIVNHGGTVDVIRENTIDQFDLESALQNGQLVIATDEDGNPVNYEMSDITMNVAYQALLHGGEGQDLDSHTILIPQADENNIVFEEATETVGTYVES